MSTSSVEILRVSGCRPRVRRPRLAFARSSRSRDPDQLSCLIQLPAAVATALPPSASPSAAMASRRNSRLVFSRLVESRTTRQRLTPSRRMGWLHHRLSVEARPERAGKRAGGRGSRRCRRRPRCRSGRGRPMTIRSASSSTARSTIVFAIRSSSAIHRARASNPASAARRAPCSARTEPAPHSSRPPR